MGMRMRSSDQIQSVSFNIADAPTVPPYPPSYPPYPRDGVTHWLSIFTTSDTDVQLDGLNHQISASSIGCGPGVVSVTYQDVPFWRGQVRIVFTPD